MNSALSMDLIRSLSDDALILRLKSFEDSFVERKPWGQPGEWRQVAVGFANSLPVDYPAVLFVGVDDKGVPQKGQDKLQSLMDTLTSTLNQIYPPIYWQATTLDLPEGSCIAVIVPGSADRPHFAGKPYVRVADGIREASALEYSSLLAERTSLVRELRRLIGKKVRLDTRKGADRKHADMVVIDCNQWFITLEVANTNLAPKRRGIPVSRLELNYDYHNERFIILAKNWE